MKEIVNELELIKKDYIKYYKDLLLENNCIFSKTIMINSVLQRSISLIDAFEKLLSSNNIMVMNGIIRMQIDNCIYVYGVFLLYEEKKDIDKIFDDTILENKQLKNFKINNIRLNDGYIVSKIDEFQKDFKDAYSFYCRFVHFSDSAGLLAMDPKDDYVMEFNLSSDYSRFANQVIVNGNTFIQMSNFVLILIKKYWTNLDNGKKIARL